MASKPKRLKKTLESTINESDLTYHEILGHGVSGEVYRVTWRSEEYGEKEAAAKKMPIIEGKSIQEQFGKEIYSLQKLKHPNLIEYYGHVITSSHLVIITEYAAKGSLHDYLQDKTQLPSDLKLKWAIEAAKGIRYLEEKNIKQLNIKSLNCLITADDNLKLCDFGIKKDLATTMTTDTNRGSVRWLAPEVLRDSRLSNNANIFALGIVLWELETCDEPYKGESDEQVMTKVLNSNLRPAIPKNCPGSLRSLMQSCWDTNRRERPYIGLIVRDLENYHDGMTFAVMGTAHLQQEISRSILACHWINKQHLAVCSLDEEDSLVEVYEVTTEMSRLAYTLKSADWEGRLPRGIAVSEAMPKSILIICDSRPFVYRFPCYEATQELEKYVIQGEGEEAFPLNLVANANAVFLVLYTRTGSKLVACQLPDLNRQSVVQITEETNFPTSLISIATDYLLVGSSWSLLLKPLCSLGDTKQDLCMISPPSEWWEVKCVAISNDAREIYAVCKQYGCNSRVYKYMWDGIGQPQYVNAGCIIDDLGWVGDLCISVSSGGLLAVGNTDIPSKVKVYTLV